MTDKELKTMKTKNVKITKERIQEIRDEFMISLEDVPKAYSKAEEILFESGLFEETEADKLWEMIKKEIKETGEVIEAYDILMREIEMKALA